MSFQGNKETQQKDDSCVDSERSYSEEDLALYTTSERSYSEDDLDKLGFLSGNVELNVTDVSSGRSKFTNENAMKRGTL